MNEGAALEDAFGTRESDDDDVRWAISTALAQWQRGGKADAIVWIRRAAEAAAHGGALERAEELRGMAARLAESMWGETDDEAIDIDVEMELEAEEVQNGAVRHRREVSPLDFDEPDLADDGTSSPFNAPPPADLSPFDGSRPPSDAFSADTRPPPPPLGESFEPTVVADGGYAGSLEAYARRADEPFRAYPEESPEVLASIGPDSRFPSSSPVIPPSGRVPRLELVPDDDAEEEELEEFEELEELEDLQDSLEPVEAAVDLLPHWSSEPPSDSGRTGPYSDPDGLIAAPSIAPSAAEYGDPEVDRPTREWIESSFPPALALTKDVDGFSLADVPGFEDLPEPVQLRLGASARVEALDKGEEVGLFGAAIVTAGAVYVLPAFADEAGAHARAGDVVFTQGSLEDNLALRVLAEESGTRVALWRPAEMRQCLEECPWVADELRFIADRYLAYCGATLGPLGAALDQSLRETVFARMDVKVFSPGEELVKAGVPLPGLYIVTGGSVLLQRDGAGVGELNAGAFVAASTLMSGGVASEAAIAGERGALVLFAARSVAHELMVMVPPLLEAMAGA